MHTEIPLKKDQDMFRHEYVLDCVEHQKILPNLRAYKVSSHVTTLLSEYNPLDILQGNLKWSDVPIVTDGEKVSDIESEDDTRGDELRKTYEKEYKYHKSSRLLYSKKEEQQIIDYIVDHDYYKILKGNSVWKSMENAGVGCGRSWQSMKEYFRKCIFVKINSYGLSKHEIMSFRVGMGLETC